MLRPVPSALLALAAASALTLTSVPAWSNAEPPALHDARSTGMGGTGIAHIDSGAAVYHNPANLERMGTVALTVGVTPFMPSVEAPFAGPGSERDSASDVVPLFFAGGGFRVHDRVTVGFGAYAQSGIGGRFEDIDDLGGVDSELQLAVIEFALPVSVRIVDELSVAVGLRMAMVSLESTTPDGQGGVVVQEFSGFAFLGFHVWLAWQPIPELRLGLTYRSKMTADMDGTVNLPGVGDVDGSAEWAITHSIRAGGAVSLLSDTLTLALEVKLQLYGESHDALKSSVDVNGQTMDNSLQLDWTTTTDVQFGVEYRFSPLFSTRLGYTLATSAVPRETANAFTPPPGLLHAITGGVGFDIDNVELGVAVSYTTGADDLDQPSVNGSPGSYSQQGLFVSLSGTYRN